MRKLIATLLTLSLLLAALSGAALAEGSAHEITSVEYPLYNEMEDTGKTVALYFLDGAADLPYIEANDLAAFLKWFYAERTYDEQRNWQDYDLAVQIDGARATFTRENEGTMVVDFDQDTMDFFDYNVFMRMPGEISVVTVIAVNPYNAAGEPTLLQNQKEHCFDRYGDEKILRLADYGIDLVAQDGLCLIPLQTVSDFLMAPAQGTLCFFNGQCLMIASSVNSIAELYYAAPSGERSEALTAYGYAELCLMLDSLYGLKDAHNIESFDQLFHESAYDQSLKGASVADADKAVYHVINYYIDDLHSAWRNFSYLTGAIDYNLPLGNSTMRFLNSMRRYGLARKAVYPDGVPGYEEVGNTAYITFDHFDYDAKDAEEYYGYENKADIPLEDTVALIVKAHEQITRENSPIENVVIDLSNNSGGNADAAICVISWLLGEGSISMEDTFTGGMSTLKYKADINLDREFDERDTVSDKNLFCLISPVSFSCGNLLPCMFKESGMVTLLGRTSGGGACAVQPISTAWGTSFQISGQRRLSFLKNGSLYDVDRGADPDIVITNPAKYYDRQALTDYINSLY